jgi:cell division protein FtsQ
MPRDEQPNRPIRVRAAGGEPLALEPSAKAASDGTARRVYSSHGPVQGRWDDDEAFGADPEPNVEPEYRRPSKPVRVKRGRINPAVWRRLKQAAHFGVFAAPVFVVVLAVYRFITASPQFALADSDHIQITGSQHVARAQVVERFASDLGRNIFFIGLENRLNSVQQIGWVRSAAVLRVWPNQIQVRITERTPVAFARVGSTLVLIDADGVLLEHSPGDNYDFPVLLGLRAGESRLAARRERVQQFLAMQAELDSEGERHSADLSEVRLSDPEDIQVTVAKLGADSAPVLLHLGDHDFLQRYKLYLAHIQEWRHTFPNISSVDLRYSGQAIITQQ